MTLVFDASAIVGLVMSAPRSVVELAAGHHTADLAHYELGNVLWKLARRGLRVEPIHRAFREVLGLLRVERVGLGPDVLELAVKHGITYYDAAYIHLAVRLGGRLVTEDGEILRKFPNLAVKTEEIIPR